MSSTPPAANGEYIKREVHLASHREQPGGYAELRKSTSQVTAGLLAIEGAHALDGKLASIDARCDAGYRMMSPSRFFDSDIGGSSAGKPNSGLTETGKATADLVAVEHLALGSDFDGAVDEPFDTTGLVTITDELFAEGFSEDQIRQIMGGNLWRFLSANLPRD